jgi:archaemetzincin
MRLSTTVGQFALAGGLVCLLVAVLICAGHCRGGSPGSPGGQPTFDRARVQKDMITLIEKLKPLHRKLGKPQAGDWLVSHPEPGQTFRQYVSGRAVLPTADRRTIYVVALGEFSPEQRKVVQRTADFIERFFALPVATQPDLPLTVIPADARRVHPSWGEKQILSTYVMEKVLLPRLPKDAFALIAFTSSDLWPGEGWNFVFGQASLDERVGVWSLYRFGDPADGEAGFRKCLRRTAATAVHELGHMFSMYHCTLYECVMCGCNNMAEADRRPIELCPECLAKVCWATGVDPASRFRKLAGFVRDEGFSGDGAIYEKSLKAMGVSTQPDK